MHGADPQGELVDLVQRELVDDALLDRVRLGPEGRDDPDARLFAGGAPRLQPLAHDRDRTVDLGDVDALVVARPGNRRRH